MTAITQACSKHHGLLQAMRGRQELSAQGVLDPSRTHAPLEEPSDSLPVPTSSTPKPLQQAPTFPSSTPPGSPEGKLPTPHPSILPSSPPAHLPVPPQTALQLGFPAAINRLRHLHSSQSGGGYGAGKAGSRCATD